MFVRIVNSLCRYVRTYLHGSFNCLCVHEAVGHSLADGKGHHYEAEVDLDGQTSRGHAGTGKPSKGDKSSKAISFEIIIGTYNKRLSYLRTLF